MKNIVFVMILISFTSVNAGAQQSTWNLIWNDEFNGTAGSMPDSTKWAYELGGTGWQNNRELQYYTNRADNASLDGQGHLIITARQEEYKNRYYTSARLNTAGKFESTYGRFEARIKLPQGQGLWPAFWMLGSNIKQSPWPACGEIDIMENIGREPATNRGSLHGQGYSGGHNLHGRLDLNTKLSDDFHIYAIEWEPNVVRFYLDNVLYQTRTPDDVPDGSKWAFDHPFYMILNVAVGGNWGGNPDSTTVFPQQMIVDYVRVYQRN